MCKYDLDIIKSLLYKVSYRLFPLYHLSTNTIISRISGKIRSCYLMLILQSIQNIKNL